MESFEELYPNYFIQEKYEFLSDDYFFDQQLPLNLLENFDSINNEEKNSESKVYQPKKMEEKRIKQSDINDMLKVNKNQNNFKKPQNLIIKNNFETIDTTIKNKNVTKKGVKIKKILKKGDTIMNP